MNTPIERRLTLRLLAYWEKLRLGRRFPAEEDIDPDDISDLWDYCFLVRASDLSKPDYNYIYLGKQIAESYTADSALISDGRFSPHTSLVATNAEAVIKSKEPIISEGEFQNLHNQTVKYRQCLLPFGKGEEVTALMGGMRFKVFS